MSLHQDNAMPTAADDEFAALMAASSLRAPHVRALSDPIPDEARSRLRETAEGPGIEQEPAACETQDADAGDGDGDDSEEEPLASYRAGNWQPPALSRFLTEVYRRPTWTMDRGPGAHGHSASAFHLMPLLAAATLETARTTDILEWLRHEPGKNRHYLVTHTRGTFAPTLLLRPTDRSSTYSSACALLRLALSRRNKEHLLGALSGTGYPDFQLAYTSLGPSASLTWVDSATRLQTTRDEFSTFRWAGGWGGPAPDVDSRHRLCTLLSQAYENALVYYAARGPGGNLRQFDQLVSTPETADLTGAGAPAPAFAALTAGRLTDLLQPAQPHPADRWTACRISTNPDRFPAGAWRPSLFSALADYPWAPRETTGQGLLTDEAALGSSTSQGATSVIDAPLTPAHLLIASDSAVSLDQAHRHNIPEQVPPPPDLDAYTAQPGSLFLLPASTPTAASHGDNRKATHWTPRTEAHERNLSSELGSSGPSESPDNYSRTPKLWSKKTEEGVDGLEQRMQLWMRQHHTEGDCGDRILIELVYRAKDPYAVTAVFYPRTEEELEWTFARELLADGLHTSVGLGDVIIWPGPEGPGYTQRIFIRLRPPGNTVLLSLDRDDALEFLEATHPLPQNLSATARTSVLTSWEQELRDLICPGPGE
ncbi:SsgA family sporulation/cell division regulator [Streptomyces sp. YIM 132580]|uniref:SsgA family sporulation/cell division regulator n=1 Tax=Streptomyces sp. YIM 132580 TaxID=2691958 RepID=UPI00136AFB99|nr:SsgA family sporulation/cell division regulator [Streptomyces sp. YIM 132580]MXG30432.1 SsgA family sporulation/cell division regulator [Streptomyces sp. YIM 132580]